ncbi:MAG: hypothetical protein SFX72_21135 [Isosphaeraceae bacterium]|nr:hypothetical protein [Isosphaeraceae bacterium]
MRSVCRRGRLLFPLLLVLVPLGCGLQGPVNVKGVVKAGGRPLSNCKVVFYPDTEKFDPDRHGYGFGMTNENGQFEIQHPNGTKGILPGSYKVTFVAWVDGKGNPIPPEAKPSEVPGGVNNLLPDKYESLGTTPTRMTVLGDNSEANFDLETR